MEQVLCPIVVGRDAELDALERALDDASHGRGRAIFLTGEAGIGKSRLVHEASDTAAARSMRVLYGRAVDADTPVPFRPLTEAVASAVRTSGLPTDPSLRPFRWALSRIVPDWGEGAREGDQSPVIIAEAFMRLLRSLASATSGALVILEDLHWADPETLAIVEYVVDNIGSEPLALVGTLRPEGHARSLLELLHARRAAEALELTPLREEEVLRMAAACLGVDALPDETRTIVTTFADGVPFLVEELLASQDAVPRSFADTVSARLDSLAPDVRGVLRAGAILGGRFDTALVARISSVPGDRVLRALEQAVRVQLLVSERRGVRFRHALTREAVLAELIAPARSTLAARALGCVEHLEEWEETAAALAEMAGLPDRAATLLCKAGRRAITRGAVSSAEEMLRRARELTSDPRVRAQASSALLEALSLAGKFDDAIEAGSDALAGAELLTASQQFDVRLALARAAVVASRWDDAAEQVERARALADELPSPALAHVDAVAAHVAIGGGRVDQATAYARRAVDRAESAGLGAVACEALEVIGRCARIGDLDGAEKAFEQARSRARARGLPLWEMRALHELGTIDLLRSADPRRLEQARKRALELGALATATTIDLQLCACYLLRADPEPAIAYGRRCREMALRLRLTHLAAFACVCAAQGYAMVPDRPAMDALLAEADTYGIDDPDRQGTAWASRGCASLFEADIPRAIREFDESMRYYRQSETTAPAHTRGMWALLRAVYADDGESAVAEVRSSGAIANRGNAGTLAYADAVLNPADAERHVATGDRLLAHVPWWLHYGRRVIAEPAMAGGWGDPVTWLREADAYFTQRGYERIASACRGLLRKAGARVTPRARTVAVPDGLRSIGVTNREAEVFVLLGEGLGNRDIADRLYLSPRTVEKHVESLMRKTGVASRGQLVAFAATQSA